MAPPPTKKSPAKAPSNDADGPTIDENVYSDWTERYRPRTLKDIVANNKPIKTMQDWANEWDKGVPDKRALVLEGLPGTGKTSAAHALAHDMGWDIIELNASDARSAPVIQRVAGQGATTNTFSPDGSFRPTAEGGRTLIVLDEADNLFERGGSAARTGAGDDLSDRGGKRAIVQTVRETRQPIILIVNDYYGLTKGSGAALRTLAETIKFQRVPARSVAKALAGICKAEGIQARPEALLRIAENADGDLRAAVNDLQSVARGRTELRAEDIIAAGRDSSRNVFQVLPDVFKGMDADVARRATWDIDENPESFILWVDENLPHQYTEPDDLARGYDRLSKADVYLGRVRRRQYYGLWSYATELMTAGVALSKQRPYKGWTKYQFPGWLRRMSSSRGARNIRDGLGKKLGRHMHTSIREARTEHLPYLQRLFQTDDELAVHLGADLRLTDDELALLLETKATTKRVKGLAEQIAAELDRRPRETAGVWADDEDASSDASPSKAATKRKSPNKGQGRLDGKGKRPEEDEDDATGSPDENVGDDGDEDDTPDDAPAAKGGKTLFDF